MAPAGSKEGSNGEVVFIASETSELVKVLVRTLLSPYASLDLVENSAELVAENARFNRWFLADVKGKVSYTALDELLAIAESVDDSVSGSWRQCEEMPGDRAAWMLLESTVCTAITRLRDVRARDWSSV